MVERVKSNKYIKSILLYWGKRAHLFLIWPWNNTNYLDIGLWDGTILNTKVSKPLLKVLWFWTLDVIIELNFIFIII